MSGYRSVRLVEGDTLWGLGERFNLPWEHIQSFNKLPDDVVYAGEELKLPLQRTKAFIVEPGDCAWEISVRFGLTLDELRDVNAGIPEVLYPGDVLFVPADAVLRPRQLWNLHAVKARLKGIAAHANAKFFDVFPYPQDIDNYREKHRLLLNALRHVESSFLMPAPIGDGGLSIGPLQISTEYHQDAWWQASNSVKYEDCEGVDYSERTAINYWLRYCPWALEFGDWETLARTHNGGPCFWHSFATTRYWRRVKNALRSRGYIQGMPEFSSSASGNASIELFSTHIPFPIPMLESEVKESNLSTSSSQLQITSAVMEAATVGVHS